MSAYSSSSPDTKTRHVWSFSHNEVIEALKDSVLREHGYLPPGDTFVWGFDRSDEFVKLVIDSDCGGKHD